MDKTINVAVKNKIATAFRDVYYICDNSDFVVEFDFDDEWESYEYKTARFIYNDKYIDVVFSGNQCEIPVISNANTIQVGVYAGDLCTTTAAWIPAKKSILNGEGVPDDPPEDVYNQIMEKLNQVGGGISTELKERLSSLEERTSDAENDIGELQDTVGDVQQAIGTMQDVAAGALEALGSVQQDIGKLQQAVAPATSIDLSSFESAGRIVQTNKDGSTVTYSFGFDAAGNPTEITDSNGNKTTLTW